MQTILAGLGTGGKSVTAPGGTTCLPPAASTARCACASAAAPPASSSSIVGGRLGSTARRSAMPAGVWAPSRRSPFETKVQSLKRSSMFRVGGAGVFVVARGLQQHTAACPRETTAPSAPHRWTAPFLVGRDRAHSDGYPQPAFIGLGNAV